jgi:hypothetical protein
MPGAALPTLARVNKKQKAGGAQMIRPLAGALAITWLTACSDLPDMNADLGPEPPGTDYPALLPTTDLQAIDAGIPEDTEAQNEALEARADALRARASGLGSE